MLITRVICDRCLAVLDRGVEHCPICDLDNTNLGDAVWLPDRPRSDTAWWLHEFQELSTNVRGLVREGRSEVAVRMIDALWTRWRHAQD